MRKLLLVVVLVFNCSKLPAQSSGGCLDCRVCETVWQPLWWNPFNTITYCYESDNFEDCVPLPPEDCGINY